MSAWPRNAPDADKIAQACVIAAAHLKRPILSTHLRRNVGLPHAVRCLAYGVLLEHWEPPADLAMRLARVLGLSAPGQVIYTAPRPVLRVLSWRL